MKQERVILSFIMVIIGLLVAGVAFYIYQGTKTIKAPRTTILTATPTPNPVTNSTYLNIISPTDESITDKKTITVSGKTTPNSTIVITTNSDQEIVEPSGQGDFSTAMTLASGANLIRITVFGSDGQTTSAQRTVTYSTEDF
jgi:hypothetical protein